MKVIINNPDNVKIEDMDEVMLRSRGVMVNSKGEVLLGLLEGTYQFPGGHVEQGEDASEGLIREIKEETGIDIEDKKYEPFVQIQDFHKNYENRGFSRYAEFNYFLIETDEKYDLEKRRLDDYEIKMKYSLEYVKIEDVKTLLDRTVNNHRRNKFVYSEIKIVMDELIRLKETKNE